MGTNITCPKCGSKLAHDCITQVEVSCPECKAELRSNGPLLMAVAVVCSLPVSLWLYSLIPESIPLIVGFLPLEMFVVLAFIMPLSFFLRVTPTA